MQWQRDLKRKKGHKTLAVYVTAMAQLMAITKATNHCGRQWLSGWLGLCRHLLMCWKPVRLQGFLGNCEWTSEKLSIVYELWSCVCLLVVSPFTQNCSTTYSDQSLVSFLHSLWALVSTVLYPYVQSLKSFEATAGATRPVVLPHTGASVGLALLQSITEWEEQHSSHCWDPERIREATGSGERSCLLNGSFKAFGKDCTYITYLWQYIVRHTLCLSRENMKLWSFHISTLKIVHANFTKWSFHKS